LPNFLSQCRDGRSNRPCGIDNRNSECRHLGRDSLDEVLHFLQESDNKIQELAARVSLTATILQAIGDAVKENEAGFKKEAFMVTWKEVLDACDATYGKLDAAILKAKGKETEKGKSKKKSSTWGKLKWALGGEAVMKELEASLEKSSQQVMMMQQVIQLTAIKLIGKS
jgi:hypothetical protein